MEQFNKVISFVLGLVVVIIFLAVATGRINLRGGIWPFTRARTTPTAARTTPTPTPPRGLALTQTPRNQGQTAPTPGGTAYNRYNYNGSTPSTIPNTGPALLLPIAAASLLGGSILKKWGSKK